MLNSVLISVAIDRPYEEVYAFLAEPRNFPSWASNLGSTFEQVNDTDWRTQTRRGPVIIRFARPNPYGILDHAVFAEGTVAETIPMRLIENEGRAQIVYTLFQRPGMDEAALKSEAEWITSDFNALKSMLETQASVAPQDVTSG